MRNSIKLVLASVLLALAGCGQGAIPGGTTSTEPQATHQTQASKQAPAPKQWVMPDLVGSNLQKAQDQMQKLTGDPVFVTRSHDLTGKNRHQVLDSNWKVCSQNVPAGSQITLDSAIDFGAVKNEEACP